MAKVFKRGGNRAKGPWYADWKDHNGRRKTKTTRTTDKAVAQQIAQKLESDAARRREGLVDPEAEKFARVAKQPIAGFVTEFELKLKAGQRSDQYVNETIGYISRVIQAMRISTVAELEPQRVDQFAAGLADEGKSARTLQAILTAIKGFSRWLYHSGRVPRDSLVGVKKPNPNGDRRHERRMLLPEEWPYLREAAELGPQLYGMYGAERALLYRVAIQTGLRANELRSLTRTSVVLDAKQPHILAKSGDTKNRKTARQFIDADLASVLATHIATIAPQAKLFNLPHASNLARMLRADLSSARDMWLAKGCQDTTLPVQREQSDFLEISNHDGKLLDFHSLRHTCGAWLAIQRVYPKTIQRVMRHSTITLTLDTYGHLLPNEESDSADKLASMFQPTVNSTVTFHVTGSKDTEMAQRIAQRAGRDMLRVDAQECGLDHASPSSPGKPNPEKTGARSDAMQSVTMPCLEMAPLAQLAEQLTLNQ